jgi:hypothetical protein
MQKKKSKKDLFLRQTQQRQKKKVKHPENATLPKAFPSFSLSSKS